MQLSHLRHVIFERTDSLLLLSVVFGTSFHLCPEPLLLSVRKRATFLEITFASLKALRLQMKLVLKLFVISLQLFSSFDVFDKLPIDCFEMLLDGNTLLR